MPLPATMAKDLEKHYAKQAQHILLVGPGYHDNGFVNCQIDGRPWELGNESKRFSELTGKLFPGKKNTFHCLRHTILTWLSQNDVHHKKSALWAGNSDTQMVDRIYTHLELEGQKEIAHTVSEWALTAVEQ